MQAPTLFGLYQHNHALTSYLHTFLSFSSLYAYNNPTSLTARSLFTLSNQPNLGIPLPCRPSNAAALTFDGQHPSFILPTCPNHRNTLLSTLFERVSPIRALLRISSILILSHLVTPTKGLMHFISNTFKRRQTIELIF